MNDPTRLLAEWLVAAGTRARALPAEPHRAQQVAASLGVSDRAMLAAVAKLGAVLVDDGWVRVLGGGADGHRADLASWNGLGDSPVLTRTPGVFCVAFDVLGGLLAMDAGAEQASAMCYFAPDTLRWESLEISYSAWLRWLLTEPDRVAGFYESLRWNGWQEEVRAVALDEAINAYPPPWTREGADLARVSRRAVPAREVVEIAFEAAREIDRRDLPG